jgi:hypothetical protein
MYAKISVNISRLTKGSCKLVSLRHILACGSGINRLLSKLTTGRPLDATPAPRDPIERVLSEDGVFLKLEERCEELGWNEPWPR